MPIGPQTPVFATMGETPPGLDPRKRAMTVRYLLTMSAGLDCDDSAPDSDRYPGSEDVLTNQDANPDASGNGGQYSMFIPDLGLVIATFSGNYADAGGFHALRELIPRRILPALIG